MRLKIGSRRSDLARLQAYTVGDALQAHHPNLEIEYIFKTSLGDRNLDTPLWTMGQKGVFTEDFVQDLEDGQVDMVVHSWKDLPLDGRTTTDIVATLAREDQRDLLLIPKQVVEGFKKGQALRVLTSSPRRSHNLRPFLPTILPFESPAIEFVNVRGNVPTRLSKLMSGEGDALIVAKAALDRLLSAERAEFHDVKRDLRDMLSQCRWMVLPLSQNPTAAAQGALAIEVARHRPDLVTLFKPIHCTNTEEVVKAERRILGSYGGGCHQKIGVSVLRRSYGELLSLRGLADSGEVLGTWRLEGKALPWPKAEPQAIYPMQLEETKQWFRREPSALDKAALSEFDALWVSRSEAWPDGLSGASFRVVWTAGIKSWQRLAARGVWVNGCSDGMGEKEGPLVDVLVETPLQWCKLSHRSGFQSGIPVVPTYRLVPSENAVSLQGKTHFFWTSGSAFLRALAVDPGIAAGYHGCGPGHTFEQIRPHLQDASRLQVFLDHESWRSAVLTANKM